MEGNAVGNYAGTRQRAEPVNEGVGIKSSEPEANCNAKTVGMANAFGAGDGEDLFYPGPAVVLERGEGVDGSISSSCTSRKGKLRLYVEMSIKQKVSSSGQEGWGSDASAEKVEPISVIVDYPNDVVVSVNARIRKSDDYRVSTGGNEDEHDFKAMESKSPPDILDIDTENDQVFNSTFVKAPFTSTLIYPILEESEVSDITTETKPKPKDISVSQRKSGESSVYHTVIGDNDTMFGNISAISISKLNMDKMKLYEPENGCDLNPNGMDLQDHPSLNLNCRSRVPSDKLTPSEKLVRAFHILARYRGAWGVFEDEGRILKHLINLNGLLTIIDNAVIQGICMQEDLREINGLISYFVLEKRFIIRSELLQTFSVLSNKSQAIAAAIFASEVPVILTGEIGKGDFTSRETHDYALFFLHLISWGQLTESQCETIGPQFYMKLISMIDGAEKNHFEPIAEVLLQVFLKYHGQLQDHSDAKWQCMQISTREHFHLFKNLKQKLMHLIVRNASSTPATMDEVRHGSCGQQIRSMLRVLEDLMICSNSLTNSLFSDTELDILMVTLTHSLEEGYDSHFQHEALTTIYRILKVIKTEPSGLDRLMKLVKTMLVTVDAGGDHSNRSALKKIYKILNRSY